jgi:WD40 repeat protein
VTAGWDGKVHVFDAKKGRMTLSFDAHDCPVIGVTISEDGKLVISRGLDGVVLFWDAKTGNIFDSLQLPDGTDDNATPRLGRLAISRDGKKLLCSQHDERVTLWDLNQSRKEPILEKKVGRLTSLDLSANGQLIAVADTDGNVQIIQSSDGSIVAGFDHHTSFVMDLAFDEMLTRLASISVDGRLVSWDLGKKTVLHDYHAISSRSAARVLGETSATNQTKRELPVSCIRFDRDNYHITKVALGSIRIDEIEFGRIATKMAEQTSD